MNCDPEKKNILSHVMAESIISSMTDIFIILDEAGKINYVNENFKSVLGYKNEDIIGKILIEYFFKIEDNFYLEKVEDTELTEHDFVKNYNTGIKTNDETILPFNVSMTPIMDRQGKIIGTAVVARDMRQMMSILLKVLMQLT